MTLNLDTSPPNCSAVITSVPKLSAAMPQKSTTKKQISHSAASTDHPAATAAPLMCPSPLSKDPARSGQLQPETTKMEVTTSNDLLRLRRAQSSAKAHVEAYL
eukprot:CAMPEP_0204454124 /NCGR_PEP_ID=MMETSP0470-20130426/102202_1 /ASSEMBLY_ACC=CAM_ASM_000385 /TAXON_ID=2969 /ORGANISM="Oxyrrhis marina" /LENGTH=102 /DNA_ID=CAMNT_0051453983 /DNA_START=492 /DNA_END=800 /DNA_ORIENTATION=+